MAVRGADAAEASPASSSSDVAAPVPAEPVQEPAVHSIVVLVNKTPVPLEGKTGYIFVDVFDKIDFDLSRPKGKGIVTTLNGRPAQYMEPIHDGDVIEIYWQE